MTRSVDEIYMNIGQNIANELENDWVEAVILAEVLDNAANFKGEYKIEAENKYFEVYDDAYDDFEELQAVTTENGSNQWNRAKFTLFPDGNFTIDFKWDQKLADEVKANS